MNKIIFFNHYHKGDLHTHKEFVRQITNEIVNVKFEYYTDNPQKLLDELNIKITDSPYKFDKNKPLYKNGDTLCVNTWVGCFWDVFCKHGGINMHTLYEQWGVLFNAINKTFGSSLVLKPIIEDYLPRINYNLLNTARVDDFLEYRKNKFKVLICNNKPYSGQSFVSDMTDIINQLANEFKEVDFYCTNAIKATTNNIFFTNDITKFADGCDLLELSYLSTKVNVIVGKNSGPYVFCETHDNYMDPNKTFISFNKKHPQHETIQETMSKGLNLKCKYNAVPINDIYVFSNRESEIVFNAIKEALLVEKT